MEAFHIANEPAHLIEPLGEGHSLHLYGNFNGVIRHPTEEDVRDLQAVLHESWTTEEGAVLYAHPELFDYENWTIHDGQEGSVHKALSDGTMHIAAVKDEEGHIVATASLIGSELGRVATSQTKAGKGHGREVIRAVLEVGRALGLDAITVDAAGIRDSMEYSLRARAQELDFVIVPTYMDPPVWGGVNNDDRFLNWGCWGFTAIPLEKTTASVRIPRVKGTQNSQAEQVLDMIVANSLGVFEREAIDNIDTSPGRSTQQVKDGLFYVDVLNTSERVQLEEGGFYCCGFHVEDIEGEQIVRLHYTDLPLQPIAIGPNRRLSQAQGGRMYTQSSQTARFYENMRLSVPIPPHEIEI